MEPGSGYHLIFLILTATVLGSLEQSCTELVDVHVSTESTEIRANPSDTVTIGCHFDCTLVNETCYTMHPVWTVQKPSDNYTAEEHTTDDQTENLWIMLHSVTTKCYENEGNFSLHLNGSSITRYNNSIVSCGLHINTQNHDIFHRLFGQVASFIRITETVDEVTSSEPQIEATSLGHVVVSNSFGSEVITPSSSFPDVPSLSTASEVSLTPVPSSSRVSPTPIPTLTLSDAFNSPEVMSSLGGVFVGGALVGAVVGGGLILLFVRRRDAAMRRDAANRIDA